MSPKPTPRAVFPCALLPVATLLFCVGCREIPLAREVGRDVDVVVVEPEPAGLSGARRQQHQDSFVQVWETVRDKHWDAELNGLDWQAVRAEFEPQIAAASSDDDVRQILGEMLSRIGESHYGIVPSSVYEDLAIVEDKPTKLAPNDRDAAGNVGDAPSDDGDDNDAETGDATTAESKKQTPRSRSGKGTLGIEARVVNDMAYVFRVEEASPAAAAGVRPGWSILEVDGRSLGKSLRRIREHNQEATTQQLMLMSSVHGRMGGRVGDAVPVVFEGDGQRHELELELAAPSGESTRFGYMPEAHFRYHSKRLTKDVGYIHFNMFMDPVTLSSSFSESIEEFMDCPGLIIDVRGNPGGIGGMVMGMSGWLIDESGRHLGVMKQRVGEIHFAVFPRAETYPGRVAILIDGCSASTAEIFAQGLRDLERARLFGRRTSGAALPSLFSALPNGDRFQYAVADYVSVNGHRIEGNGVNPDEPIAFDPEAFARGEDPDVAAALRWIGSRSGS
ncbi:MAG: S41 family peptidase [Planctomycetota bacterium]